MLADHFNSKNILFGTFSNFFGAVFFNVDTIAGYMHLKSFVLIETLEWGAAIVGGLCFFLGGVAEWRENIGGHMLGLGISFMNTFGGFFFVIAGVAGIFPRIDEDKLLYNWLVNFTYLVGSILFFLGSMIGLWMSKKEMFGLAWVPAMNTGSDKLEVDGEVLRMQAEYGCGTASALQLPFLIMYMLSSAASVILFSVTITPGCINDSDSDLAVTSGLHFMLSHGILLLASVIHHTPTARPFNWLLHYMRLFMCLYFVNQGFLLKRVMSRLCDTYQCGS